MRDEKNGGAPAVPVKTEGDRDPGGNQRAFVGTGMDTKLPALTCWDIVHWNQGGPEWVETYREGDPEFPPGGGRPPSPGRQVIAGQGVAPYPKSVI